MTARGVEHMYVRRLLGKEQFTGVHRRGVQRIMVAGEQIDLHSDTAHDLQRLADDARCQLIGFEDITAHHHEVTTLRHSNFAKGGNSLSTRG
ncbi:Uncharacterised protein [Mycobacteroides abscessus subsp. abscessus]|nr:Uncharacterised protein [Mycobacteroides abscessus subsp. abscessus]